MESLHDIIPKDVLPELYGGTGGNIEEYEGKFLLIEMQILP